MIFSPHDYQSLFLDDAVQRITTAKPGDRFLYASPTGTGKSVMELTLLAELKLRGFTPVLITQRLEIVAGMLAKLGVACEDWNDAKLADAAFSHSICTPIRFRNQLSRGVAEIRPDIVILDEAHHGPAATYTELNAYLGNVIWVGLTATPFRGTPKGTKEFLDEWGDVTQILTIQQAAARGSLAIPTAEVWPLVDDDLVEIVNGELKISSIESLVTSSIDEVVRRCAEFGRGAFGQLGKWDRPTLFATPTAATCYAVADALTRAGLPAAGITQDTPRARRNEVFAAATRSEVAVVQIDVVSEGVDLPFRRLIDLRPTMSPVKWMQQVGRITRPTDTPPQYICCNRNIERHGYLFDGALPLRYIAAAQAAFKTPTKRAIGRALGLESIGKFQSIELPLADGCIGSMFLLVSSDQFAKTEYAAIAHPAHAEILYARRVNSKDAAGMVTWGRWEQVPELPDTRGFTSAPQKTLSPKQEAKWRREAASVGLDPAVGKVNRKNFAALPLLQNLRMKIGA